MLFVLFMLIISMKSSPWFIMYRQMVQQDSSLNQLMPPNNWSLNELPKIEHSNADIFNGTSFQKDSYFQGSGSFSHPLITQVLGDNPEVEPNEASSSVNQEIDEATYFAEQPLDNSHQDMESINLKGSSSDTSSNTDNVRLENPAVKKGKQLKKKSKKSRKHTKSQCNSCGLYFNSKYLLKKHEKIHKRFKCKICGEEMDSAEHKRNHMLTKHNKTESLETQLSNENKVGKETEGILCTVCDKKLRNGAEFRQHKREVHGLDLMICVFCGKEFANRKDMLVHQKIHEDKDDFQCYICEKSLKTVRALKTHVRSHKTYGQFLCTLCGKEYHNKSSLYHHELTHEPVECKICGKILKSKGILRKHIQTHSNKTYPCDICGKVLHNSNSLYKHKLIHKGEEAKRHRCTLCEKKFSCSQKLKIHAVVHNRSKPYKCPICANGYTQPYYVKLHMKTQHGITPPKSN